MLRLTAILLKEVHLTGNLRHNKRNNEAKFECSLLIPFRENKAIFELRESSRDSTIASGTISM